MNFTPLSSQDSAGQNLSQINNMLRDLSKEQQVKVFKGPGGYNAVQEGKIGTNHYGAIYSDASHRRIIIGQDPDGNINIHVSKAGYDVVDLFT